jgi:hypothetical protein
LSDANNLFVELEANNKTYNFEITNISNNKLERYKILSKIDPIFAIIYQQMDDFKCR